VDLSSGVIVAAVVIAALLFYSIRTYNRLVALRNRVRNAWSDIDVQLRNEFGKAIIYLPNQK